MLKKIISGGQTGVDRAALDAAIDCNFPYGGYIPRGRLAEDGVIDEKYSLLVELNSDDYSDRTKKNIEDSDGTVVVYDGICGKGTMFTIYYAKEMKKPVLVIDLSKTDVSSAVKEIETFVGENRINVLNVAGPRASIDPEIYKKAYPIIRTLIENLR